MARYKCTCELRVPCFPVEVVADKPELARWVAEQVVLERSGYCDDSFAEARCECREVDEHETRQG